MNPSLVYIHNVRESASTLGVLKKIGGLTKHLETVGQVRLLLPGKILGVWLLVLLGRHTVNKGDIVIIRSPVLWSPVYVLFLLKIRRCEKVYLEMPTYPFIGELRGLKRLYYVITSSFYYIPKHLNFTWLTNYSHDDLYGCRTIRVYNGYLPDKFTMKRERTFGKIIKLVSVANHSFFHGTDRVLEGLARSKSKCVELHIIGEGEYLNALKDLTDKYNLNDRVIFHGMLKGHDLSNVLYICHVGVGTLAMHRKGLYEDCSLKTAEYLWHGLPVIMSAHDERFNGVPYIFHQPPDDSPVDIESIIDAYEAFNNGNITLREIQTEVIARSSWKTAWINLTDDILKV